MCLIAGFMVWSFLSVKYPGRGLKVIKNAFREPTSFEQAIQDLKRGNRIRRKTEGKGYTKLVIFEGKRQKEKFGTYWVRREDDISDYCTFSIEDVLASDWIIDE